MKLEGLIIGEIYSYIRGNGYSDNFENSYFIGKFRGEATFGEYIFVGNSYYCSSSWSYKNSESIKEIKLASLQEREHLVACIKAGKYVEMPKQPLELISSFSLF